MFATPKLRQLKATKDGKQISGMYEMMGEYFKPGRIVEGYGGWDEVIAYNPPNVEEGEWRWYVTVREVKDQFGNEPDFYHGGERSHSTEPEAKNVIAALEKDGWDFGDKRGTIYAVDLKPQEDEYLLWDKPVAEQSGKVKKALASSPEIDTKQKPAFWDESGDTHYYSILRGGRSTTLGKLVKSHYDATYDVYHAYGPGGFEYRGNASNLKSGKEWIEGIPPPSWYSKEKTGEDIYAELVKAKTSEMEASLFLKTLGIRGIKYLDGTSRGRGEGNYNYVIFDDADVEIEAMYQKRTRDELRAMDKAFSGEKRFVAEVTTKAKLQDAYEKALKGVDLWNLRKTAKMRDMWKVRPTMEYEQKRAFSRFLNAIGYRPYQHVATWRKPDKRSVAAMARNYFHADDRFIMARANPILAGYEEAINKEIERQFQAGEKREVSGGALQNSDSERLHRALQGYEEDQHIRLFQKRKEQAQEKPITKDEYDFILKNTPKTFRERVIEVDHFREQGGYSPTKDEIVASRDVEDPQGTKLHEHGHRFWVRYAPREMHNAVLDAAGRMEEIIGKEAAAPIRRLYEPKEYGLEMEAEMFRQIAAERGGAYRKALEFARKLLKHFPERFKQWTAKHIAEMLYGAHRLAMNVRAAFMAKGPESDLAMQRSLMRRFLAKGDLVRHAPYRLAELKRLDTRTKALLRAEGERLWKEGKHTFEEFEKELVGLYGDGIGPHLEPLYNAIRDTEADMSGYEDVLYKLTDERRKRLNPEQRSLFERSYEVDAENRWRTYRRYWQDRFNRVKYYTEAIREQGGEIRDDNNPYLAEELHYGKIEQTQKSKRYLKHLTKKRVLIMI